MLRLRRGLTIANKSSESNRIRNLQSSNSKLLDYIRTIPQIRRKPKHELNGERSLRGRRLFKGMGKTGVLGARETRGGAWSRALIPFPGYGERFQRVLELLKFFCVENRRNRCLLSDHHRFTGRKLSHCYHRL